MANNAENYVNGIFVRATNELCKVVGSRINTKGSLLYDVQVEYAYLVKNITGGPEYISPKFVSKIESFVDKIHAFVDQTKESGGKALDEAFEFPPTGKTYAWRDGGYRRFEA